MIRPAPCCAPPLVSLFSERSSHSHGYNVHRAVDQGLVVKHGPRCKSRAVTIRILSKKQGPSDVGVASARAHLDPCTGDNMV